MTTVAFVSNPEVEVSTHTWTVQGVSQLTRENKISSLPFWVPNDQVKTHQFRLVLLKGLTPAAKEADDAYGLVLELVPPPADPTGAETPASRYPGGCFVTLRVASHAQPSVVNVTASQTVLVDESNTQVCFPDALPAAAARNAALVSGDPAAVTFELTIRTGINVLAQQIASSVTSLWSTLTASVLKLVDTTVKVYHEGRKEFEETSRGPAPAAASYAEPPWEHPPAKWATRGAEWRALVRDRATLDDGFFLHGPERGVTEDERQFLLKAGFNYRLLVGLYTRFNFDRDVHEGLLVSDAIRQQRYHLVPAKIKEGLFWANYFWKVACLATCDDAVQVRTLLAVVNAPPAAAPRRPDPAISGRSEREVMDGATDAQEAADLLLEYLDDTNNEDDAFLMETAASTCEDHARRLEHQFRRSDLAESTLLVVGTTLRRLRERVARYHDVVRARKAVNEAQVARVAVSGLTPEAPVTAVEAPAAQAAPAAPGDVQDAEQDAVSPEPRAPAAPPATSARAGSGGAAAVEFPKMPWEEDEEETS